MQDQIKDAKNLKNQALDLKGKALDTGDDGLLSEARAVIDKAVAILEGLWAQRGQAIEAAGAGASPDERSLVAALAETYGVKGGILRSSGDPEGAFRAYDRGVTFEAHQARKVDNSYNLVQRLTNRLLAYPAAAGATRWVVGSGDEAVDMLQELERARAELERQTGTSRDKDPWAAADKVTVELLLAPRDPSTAEAQVAAAYRDFEKLKPEPDVYESTLRAFRDLRGGLEKVAAGERTEGWHSFAGLLDSVIKRLDDDFEAAKAGLSEDVFPAV